MLLAVDTGKTQNSWRLAQLRLHPPLSLSLVDLPRVLPSMVASELLASYVWAQDIREIESGERERETGGCSVLPFLT